MDFVDLKQKAADPNISDEAIGELIKNELFALFDDSNETEGVILREGCDAEFERYKEVLSGRELVRSALKELEDASRWSKGFRRFKNAFRELLSLDGPPPPESHLHQWAFIQFRGLRDIAGENDCQKYFAGTMTKALGLLKKKDDKKVLGVLREFVGSVIDESPPLREYVKGKIDVRLLKE